jgi:3-hydroxyisobutyrate dehydrogenase-like beta-hydroxyacid dehydrogenase
MVGGEADAFERALPLLEVLGSVIRHMGAPGSGQATKLTNNVLAATLRPAGTGGRCSRSI